MGEKSMENDIHIIICYSELHRCDLSNWKPC